MTPSRLTSLATPGRHLSDESALPSDQPRTISDLLERAARLEPERGLIYVDGGEERRQNWPQLLDEAGEMAGRLRGTGLQSGDRIALLLGDLRGLVTAFFAAQMGGLQPSILPTPVGRRRLASYVRHASGVLRVARPRRVLVDEALARVDDELVAAADLEGGALLRADELQPACGAALSTPWSEGSPAGDDASNRVCLIQFTSGSTSAPRGVVLENRQVMANVRAIVDHLGVTPEDIGGGWLPLFHDMGLIGNLLSATAACMSLVMTTPFGFLRRPRRWLEIMERHRVSATAGPNASYRHLLRRGRPGGQRLDAWRIAIVGAEPIDPYLLESFSAAFEPLGMSPTAFTPAYGLAEVGLMVTGSEVDRRHTLLRCERDSFENAGLVSEATRHASGDLMLVGVGEPIGAMQVRILDCYGLPVPDGTIGEIVIAGDSVMSGYFDNERATAEVLRDGWLHSGDLGFFRNGELFVTGRAKELIIVDGRNIYPQDIEWVVEGLAEVRDGSAVAFGVDDGDREGIVVVASPANGNGRAAAPAGSDNGRRSGVAAAIREAVADGMGLPLLDVVLVERGRIPRTTSGKRCRAKCRTMYMARELP